VDLKRLSHRILPDNQPPPVARQIFDQLKGFQRLMQFDFANAYLQMEVAESCRQYLSFVTPWGRQYEFMFVPFGLNIAGGALQRQLNTAFQSIPFALGYADDWLVPCNDDQLLTRLRAFLTCTKSSGFLLKPAKCKIGFRELTFLGRVVSPDGLALHPDDVECIKSWPVPQDKTTLSGFLGLVTWCAEHLPGFARHAKVLQQVAKPSATFFWGHKEDQAFQAVKALTLKSLRLALPDFNKPFILETDASRDGFGAILRQEGVIVRIAHRRTTPAEAGLPITFLELSCVVWAVSYFHVYLHGVRFTVLTDHRALEWLRKPTAWHGKLALWALALAEYNFSIHYKPGATMIAADALSRRLPIGALEAAPAAMPTVKEILDAQSIDGACEDVKARLHSGDLRATKGFVLDVDGVLATLTLRYDYPVLRPVIPPSLQARVLAAVHDRAAHLSSGTVQLAKANFHWKTLVTDAEAFCKQCPACQHAKHPTGFRQIPTGTVTASRPNELIAADLLELPATPDGFQYVLVVMDYFTRYVSAAALKSKRAIDVADGFASCWLSPLGAPSSLLTDQGSEFAGAEFASRLRTLGIGKRWTVAYHPQTDGMVERMNRTIIQSLTALSAKQAWPQALPGVIQAINNSVASSTKHSPYFLMFGRNNTSNNVLQPLAPSPEQQQSLQQAHVKATLDTQRTHQQRRTELNKRNEAFAKPLAFVAGDWVAVLDPKIRQAAGSKLTPQWVGPCKVLMKKSLTNYVVRQHPHGYVGTTNVSRMKKWVGSVVPQPAAQPAVQPSTQRAQTSIQQPAPSARVNADWHIFPKGAQGIMPAQSTAATAATATTTATTAKASQVPDPPHPRKEPAREHLAASTEAPRKSSRAKTSTESADFVYSSGGN
jgi:transposase InsO family protein